MKLVDNTEGSSSLNQGATLSNKLQILYGLNGATLSLPSLAFIALVNDRVAIPIDLLSAYGALTFLPWSFKPLYGMLERMMRCKLNKRRHVLLIILYLFSSISIVLTATIPKNGVVPCFILGFVRGIVTSFPEFLIDLLLIDEAKDVADKEISCSTNDGNITARKQTLFEKASGIFQAQASASRNFGSLIANVTICILLLFLQFHNKDNQGGSATQSQLSDPVITAILLVTSLLPLMASFVVMTDFFEVKLGHNYCNSITNLMNNGYEKITVFASSLDTNFSNFEVEGRDENTIHVNNFNENAIVEDVITPMDKTLCATTTYNKSQKVSLSLEKWDFFGIFMFQCLIIWSALKRMIDASSATLWLIGFTTFTVSVFAYLIRLISIRCNSSNESSSFVSYGPALFLILKQAIPQASYQWYSYTYYLFQTSPFYLQIISLIGISMSTFGSNIYAKFIAPKNINLIKIFIATITMNTCISFFYLIVSDRWNNEPEKHLLMNFLILMPITSLSAFFSELQFLPSIVLATSCVQLPIDSEENEHNSSSNIKLNQENTKEESTSQLFSIEEDSTLQSAERVSDSNSDNDDHDRSEGVQYGLYTGCIDFGDQIGAWLSVPLVSALGINRNDWSKLSELIFICAFCNLSSILFLFLIVPTMRRQRRNI